MSDVIIFGFPQSTYVRTAAMACVEKGVAYEVRGVDFMADDYRGRHPFQKIPAFQHGDFHCIETPAIAVYVDQRFEGPPLQPADPAGKALMWQWISSIECYMYPALIPDIVIERVVVPLRGGVSDEEKIKAALPRAEYCLDVLNEALESSAWLAGDQLTIADLFLAPIAAYIAASPDIGDSARRRGGLTAWLARISERPSFTGTNPPPPKL